MRERTDREVARELDDLRARLAAAQLEEEHRRKELEQLRKDFARLTAALIRTALEKDYDDMLAQTAS